MALSLAKKAENASTAGSHGTCVVATTSHKD